MLAIGLEWIFDDKEFEQHWRDLAGNPLPLLPIGSKIQIEKADDFEKWSFLLQVREIKAHFEVGNYPYIAMICDVISNDQEED